MYFQPCGTSLEKAFFFPSGFDKCSFGWIGTRFHNRIQKSWGKQIWGGGRCTQMFGHLMHIRLPLTKPVTLRMDFSWCPGNVFCLLLDTEGAFINSVTLQGNAKQDQIQPLYAVDVARDSSIQLCMTPFMEESVKGVWPALIKSKNLQWQICCTLL